MADPTAGALDASYRDPHGFVFRRDDILYRQVNEAHRTDWDRFVGSGLAEHLVERGWLVGYEEVPVSLGLTGDAYRVLQPDPIPFVSYPYEWCFSQLRDAALLTLDLQAAALERGMTLRDATSFNVAFHHGRPVFIDVTSFGVWTPGEPWVAYRQFCEQFLAPLALAAHVDLRLLGMQRAMPDGIPLDLASELLPGKAKRRPGVAMHITMHARSQRRHAGDDRGARSAREFGARAFEGLVSSLRGVVEGLPAPRQATEWGDYYGQAEHYTAAATASKARAVTEGLAELGPRTVWDLGANTGRYARIAADAGAEVLAFDMDPMAVELAYRDVRARDERRLLPLLHDLVNPSPALGLRNRERTTVAERGPADTVMALALVHHLAIGRNVPLARVADLLADLGRSAIAEWVPRSDVRVQQLLAGREDVFATYEPAVFEAAMQERFRLVRTVPLDESERVVYILDRR